MVYDGPPRGKHISENEQAERATRNGTGEWHRRVEVHAHGERRSASVCLSLAMRTEIKLQCVVDARGGQGPYRDAYVAAGGTKGSQ
jgi:hypothetical protein